MILYWFAIPSIGCRQEHQQVPRELLLVIRAWKPKPVETPWHVSAVSRGQREHKDSSRGYSPKEGGAVFSWLLSLAVLVLCVISLLKLPSLNTDLYWLPDVSFEPLSIHCPPPWTPSETQVRCLHRVSASSNPPPPTFKRVLPFCDAQHAQTAARMPMYIDYCCDDIRLSRGKLSLM